MSNAKTIVYRITTDGVKEDIQDDNFGINLFANTIQYPDENKGVYHNIAEYYKKSIEGNLGDTTKDAMTVVQDAIKSKKGDKYDETIEKFSSYNENSDISPYACLIAGETIDVANKNGGTLYTEHLQFFYENSYSSEKSSTNGVYNLSFYDEWNRPNLGDWLLLEGNGFYEIPSTYSVDMDFNGGFVNFDIDDVIEIPKLSSSDTDDLLANKNYNFSKTEKGKITDLIDSIEVERIAHGDITHEKLIELMNCIPVNHDLNDVEKQCAEDFNSGKITVFGWNQCLKEKGYVWNGVCDPGFTFDVLPQLENVEKDQQDSIDSKVANGIYKFNKAAFEFTGSGQGISCYDIRYVTYVWRAICILAPFLLIIFGSLDFIKAIMANDEKAQKQATKKLPKRIGAFIILLVLPILLRLIFRFGQYNSGNLGLLKCVVTFDTTSKASVSKSRGIDSDPSDYPMEKKKCSDYGAGNCPEIDGYGYKCKTSQVKGTTSSFECVRTGDVGISCPNYGLTDCPKEDDFGKACTLKKTEVSSVPVCDYDD